MTSFEDQLNQPYTALGGLMPTLVELLTNVLTECEEKREQRHPHHDASREFAIAATHIEEAIMRINRGFAKQYGQFQIADVEADNVRRNR